MEPLEVLQRYALGLILLSLTSEAWSNHYFSRMDVAEWRVEVSPFICRMTQPIPYYGEAVFERRAGETVGFYLKSGQEYMAKGKALVQTKAPVWQPERNIRSLGYVPVVRHQRAITLDEQLALSMLDELHRGMELDFKRQSWYHGDESVRVELSPVSFRPAYRTYTDCLAQLLPVNFEQIERSTMYFATAKHELTDPSMVKLEHIIAYLKADPTVEAMFVDGHTDSVGNRQKNVELSKRRSEEVSNYLITSGIGPERITTRFHGERYPVASNGTRNGRAQNRRVTIRLEREKPPGLLGDGSNSAQFGF